MRLAIISSVFSSSGTSSVNVCALFTRMSTRPELRNGFVDEAPGPSIPCFAHRRSRTKRARAPSSPGKVVARDPVAPEIGAQIGDDGDGRALLAVRAGARCRALDAHPRSGDDRGPILASRSLAGPGNAYITTPTRAHDHRPRGHRVLEQIHRRPHELRRGRGPGSLSPTQRSSATLKTATPASAAASPRGRGHRGRRNGSRPAPEARVASLMSFRALGARCYGDHGLASPGVIAAARGAVCAPRRNGRARPDRRSAGPTAGAVATACAIRAPPSPPPPNSTSALVGEVAGRRCARSLPSAFGDLGDDVVLEAALAVELRRRLLEATRLSGLPTRHPASGCR